MGREINEQPGGLKRGFSTVCVFRLELASELQDSSYSALPYHAGAKLTKKCPTFWLIFSNFVETGSSLKKLSLNIKHIKPLKLASII